MSDAAFSRAYEGCEYCGDSLCRDVDCGREDDDMDEVTTTDTIGSLQHDVLIDGDMAGTVMLTLLSGEAASDGPGVVYTAFFGEGDDASCQRRGLASYGEAMAWIVERYTAHRDSCGECTGHGWSCGEPCKVCRGTGIDKLYARRWGLAKCAECAWCTPEKDSDTCRCCRLDAETGTALSRAADARRVVA